MGAYSKGNKMYESDNSFQKVLFFGSRDNQCDVLKGMIEGLSWKGWIDTWDVGFRSFIKKPHYTELAHPWDLNCSAKMILI